MSDQAEEGAQYTEQGLLHHSLVILFYFTLFYFMYMSVSWMCVGVPHVGLVPAEVRTWLLPLVLEL